MEIISAAGVAEAQESKHRAVTMASLRRFDEGFQSFWWPALKPNACFIFSATCLNLPMAEDENGNLVKPVQHFSLLGVFIAGLPVCAMELVGRNVWKRLCSGDLRMVQRGLYNNSVKVTVNPLQQAGQFFFGTRIKRDHYHRPCDRCLRPLGAATAFPVLSPSSLPWAPIPYVSQVC